MAAAVVRVGRPKKSEFPQIYEPRDGPEFNGISFLALHFSIRLKLIDSK